jgi:AraC-type DNA-binding domain-containing proteins
MSKIYSEYNLMPKQPEFVIATSNYNKKVIMKYNIAHFYQFTAEADNMGVIPDACVDILIWKKDGKLISKIAGSRLEKGVADTDLNGEYFGIRFMPGFNPISNKLPLKELVNQEWDFADMLNSNEGKEKLMDALFYSQTFDEKINIFMSYYFNQYKEQLEENKCLKNVIRNEIIKANGNIKLTDLSFLTGYTERYLNKKIHDDFGMNPKSLIQFIRFQKAIGNLTDTIDHIDFINTALESGYYDQSHFIKDFKKFSGLTPSNYIENLLYHSYDKKLHVLN